MFNASSVITQKGPLANLWTVIRNPRKLSKEQIISTNIKDTIDSIPDQDESIDTISSFIYALAYIYSKKVIYTESDMRTFERRMSVNNSNDTIDTSNTVDMLVRAADDNDMTISADFNLSRFDNFSTDQNWLDMTAADGSSISRFISSPSDKFKTPETNRRSSGFSSLETQRAYQSIGENMNEAERNALEYDYTEPMIDQDEIFEQQMMGEGENIEGRESITNTVNRRKSYEETMEKLKDSLENNQLELDGNTDAQDEDYDGLTASAKHRRSQSLINKSKRRRTYFDEVTELPDEIVRKMKNDDLYSDEDNEESDEDNDNDSSDEDEEDNGNRSKRKKRNNNNDNNNKSNMDKIIKKRKYKKPEYSKFINPIVAFIRALPTMKKLPRDEDNDEIEEIDLTKLGYDGEEDVGDEDFDIRSMNNNNNNQINDDDTIQQTPIDKDTNNTISYLDGPTFNDTLDDMYEMGNNSNFNGYNNDGENNNMNIEEQDTTMIINQVSRSMEIVSDLKGEFEDNDVVEFQQMVSNKTRRNIASDFLGLLTLAANDYVVATQSAPYEAIEIEKGLKWSEFD